MSHKLAICVLASKFESEPEFKEAHVVITLFGKCASSSGVDFLSLRFRLLKVPCV